jgi:hypothetical protein
MMVFTVPVSQGTMKKTACGHRVKSNANVRIALHSLLEKIHAARNGNAIILLNPFEIKR